MGKGCGIIYFTDTSIFNRKWSDPPHSRGAGLEFADDKPECAFFSTKPSDEQRANPGFLAEVERRPTPNKEQKFFRAQIFQFQPSSSHPSSLPRTYTTCLPRRRPTNNANFINSGNSKVASSLASRNKPRTADNIKARIKTNIMQNTINQSSKTEDARAWLKAIPTSWWLCIRSNSVRTTALRPAHQPQPSPHRLCLWEDRQPTRRSYICLDRNLINNTPLNHLIIVSTSICHAAEMMRSYYYYYYYYYYY